MRRLMDAGRSLFAERGYHNVHAGDIAGVAGVAVGSFYAYFDDKHRLFLALVDEFTEEVLNRESSVVQTATEHQAEEISIEGIFNRVFNTSVEAHRHSAAFFREVLRMSLADPEVRSRLERIEMRARGALEAGLLEFRKGLSKKKATELAFIIYYASEGVTHRLALFPGEVDEKQAIGSLSRMCAALVTDE